MMVSHPGVVSRSIGRGMRGLLQMLEMFHVEHFVNTVWQYTYVNTMALGRRGVTAWASQPVFLSGGHGICYCTVNVTS